jgi:hypothetical protein
MTLQTLLLWRDGDVCGAQGLLHWRSFIRRPDDEFFASRGEPAQIGQLARAALNTAFLKSMNILIGWGEDDPTAMRALEVETEVQRLWPCTIFCPERAGSNRWIAASFGEPSYFATSSMERVVGGSLLRRSPIGSPAPAAGGHTRWRCFTTRRARS